MYKTIFLRFNLITTNSGVYSSGAPHAEQSSKKCSRRQFTNKFELRVAQTMMTVTQILTSLQLLFIFSIKVMGFTPKHKHIWFNVTTATQIQSVCVIRFSNLFKNLFCTHHPLFFRGWGNEEPVSITKCYFLTLFAYKIIQLYVYMDIKNFSFYSQKPN